MKKLVLLLILTTMLSGCTNQDENNIEYPTDKEICMFFAPEDSFTSDYNSHNYRSIGTRRYYKLDCYYKQLETGKPSAIKFQVSGTAIWKRSETVGDIEDINKGKT